MDRSSPPFGLNSEDGNSSSTADANWASLNASAKQGLPGGCAVLGTSGGLVGTMPVDRFGNLDTIGTSVKSGKIGFTGRTRKVDTSYDQAIDGSTPPAGFVEFC